MHQRCVAGANEGGRQRRVVADIAKLSVGREEGRVPRSGGIEGVVNLSDDARAGR
jgi:hypothetical protein